MTGKIFSLAIIVAMVTPALALAATPEAPTWAGTAIVPGDCRITLNWRTAAGASASCRVRYRTSNSSEPWVSSADLPAGLTTYTVTGLRNLKSYEFQVGAAGAWGATEHARPRGASHPSGLHGGGQINAIVKAGGGTMVAGSDVAAFQRSLDGGETWFQSSRGVIQGANSRSVASLIFHRASGTLYGVTGGRNYGNFWKSADNGETWTHLSSGAELAAEANSNDYPRRVGRLIAIDPANPSAIYLGTMTGIKKSADGGATWSALALTGEIVRSLILDNGIL
ncbi:MAG: hypothetical protein Q8N47_14705 [Bryobacterales bacterium]|nr:hypothetical protein [Bryobacterales bacterium]